MTLLLLDEAFTQMKKPTTDPIAADATGAVLGGRSLPVVYRQVGPVAGVTRAERHRLRGRGKRLY
jgi:hypothetical protein